MLSVNDLLRDRYKILRQLGQGGMGAVYEAHDNVFDTSVALKEIVVDLSNSSNTNAQEMVHAAFEREAKLLAKINHETFPHVKDYFSDDDRQFLVMELVDGEDLAHMLKTRQSPFPVSDILEWTDQLLDGLDYLHNQTPPIIHRDLKPQNLKINSRGKIKLLDFGIAKGTDSSNPNTITDQTFIAATLNYSPIEQMLRVIDPTFLAVITHKYNAQVEPILQQGADFRSDIYALGATLYNLLTNIAPVEAVKRAVEVWDGNPDPLKHPGSVNEKIPLDLSDFLLKAMQISRDHRFSSAKEMRSALKQIGSANTNPQSAQKTEVMHFPTPSDAAIPQPGATDSQQRITEQLPNDAINSDVNSVETIAAPAGLFSQEHPNTGGSAIPPHNSIPNPTQNQPTNTPQPQKKRSLKFLWAIPVLGLLFMVVGVGAVGAWWLWRNNSSVKTDTNSNSNVSTIGSRNDDTDTNTTPEPSVSPSEDIFGGGENTGNENTNSTEDVTATPKTVTKSTPRPQPTRNTTTVSTPRPATPRPTVRPRTPRPTPVIVRQTPRPTPKKKKDMNCILTDSCK